MTSFTSMSEAAIEAVIDANEKRMDNGGEQYALTLNRYEFERFVSALKVAHDENPAEMGDWCADFLSGIAGTLGVEFV